MKVGEQYTPTPLINPEDAYSKKLTWKSKNSKVASVSSTGKITAKGVGSAVIKATAYDGSGKEAALAVTVEPVAQIGEAIYGTLKGAIEAAKPGDIITMLDDVSVDNSISLNKDITLDFNGKTLTYSGGDYAVVSMANTVLKNGSVETATGNGALKATSGKFSVEGVSVKSAKRCLAAYDSSAVTIDAASTLETTGTENTIVVYGDGVYGQQSCKTPRLEVDGKVLNSCSEKGAALSGNGSDMSKPNIVLGPTAVLESKSDYAVYQPQGGTLVVNGAQLKGAGGIEAKAGVITIGEGSAVTATAADKHHVENNNGTSTYGYGIALAENANYVQGAPDLNIGGGTFIGMIDVVTDSAPVNATKASISGGKFSTDPGKYITQASVAHHVGNWYTVHGKNAAVSSSSGKAATCTTAGYTGGSYCSVDGYTYSAGSTIPALGHDYSWVTTTPATEDAEGVMTGTCSRGDSIVTKAIPKLPKAGSNETATDGSGAKVDVTVVDNKPGKTASGTEYVGSVEYNGAKDTAAASEARVPETVTVNGSTYVVTKIADEAFEGQEQLTKVTIPETVVEIGERAFAGTSLESVTIPAATAAIGAGVFQGCDDLKSVDISKTSITAIPADAFNGTAISSIEIPATVTSVGARAFKGTKLTSIALPKAVKSVEKSTFANCAQLKSVSTSATSIGYRALSGCTSLKSIDLSKAAEIGKYALKGDSKLKIVTTGTKLKAIGYRALAGTKVKTLVIKSKKLTQKSVKGSLKGSNVRKVEVAVSGSKKTVRKYVAKYEKTFKKSNSGKSVEVVAAKKNK